MEVINRKMNLTITGSPGVSRENHEQAHSQVQKLVMEKLLLPNVVVKGAYRVGSSDGRSQPRPIIAKLGSTENKIACFKSSNKLKGTDTFILEDVWKDSLAI